MLKYAIVRRGGQRFIAAYRFPEALVAGFHDEYPDLGEAEVAEVFEGLRGWFDVCRRARRRSLTMPSRVVDDAWHEFILCTREYAFFCTRAFGRYLHHVSAGGVVAPESRARGRVCTWHLACVAAGLDPAEASNPPRIFRIDSDLAVAGGFVFGPDEVTDLAAAARDGHRGSPCAGTAGTAPCESGCGSGCASLG